MRSLVFSHSEELIILQWNKTVNCPWLSTKDYLTLWWWESDMHSVGTTFNFWIFTFYWSTDVWSSGSELQPPVSHMITRGSNWFSPMCCVAETQEVRYIRCIFNLGPFRLMMGLSEHNTIFKHTAFVIF
jgi:hypothetical protein